jgi:hypothetical protein
MAWTQAQLDALNKAIAVGSDKVKYADREVTYRSLSDMLKLRAAMMDELNLPGTTRNPYKKLSYSKGIQ